ncbi:MAG: hypothetical protein ACK5T0_10340 [Vampirovibrionales bacterium]
MNAVNPSFNNGMALPQTTMPPTNTVEPQVLGNVKNASVPPVVDDNFVRQDFESKQQKDVKTKEKKPFNPWKWMVLTPLILGGTLIVGAPLGGALAFRHWFLKNPSELSKVLKPTDIEKMFADMRAGKEIKVPKEFKLPDLKGMDEMQQMGAFLNTLRFLPAENKKKIMQYLFSFKGIKECSSLVGTFIQLSASSGKLEKIKTIMDKANLNPIHEIFERGGTVTKKAGQGIADKLKPFVIFSDALKQNENLFKNSAEKEEFETSLAIIEKMYKVFGSMQSKDVKLMGKEKEHFQYLYEQGMQYNKTQKLGFTLQDVSFDNTNLKQASMAVVSLDCQNVKALKIQRPDALPNRAADNLEFLAQINHMLNHNLSGLEEKLSDSKIKIDPEKQRIDGFKKGLNAAHDILQGSRFENEKLGLDRIEEAARWIGADPKYDPPKAYWSKNFKGKNGKDEYGVVFMDMIQGQNTKDLSEKAQAEGGAFSFEKSAWKPYNDFMGEHAHNVLLRQASNAVSTDNHSGNIMQSGKVLDVAEHRYIPIAHMNKIADLVTSILKDGQSSFKRTIERVTKDGFVTTTSSTKGQASGTVINKLKAFMDTSKLQTLAKAQGVSVDELLKKAIYDIYDRPLEAIDVLYNTHDLGDALKPVAGSVGLNKQSVKRATDKFSSMMKELANYKKVVTKNPTASQSKTFLASEDKMARDFVRAYASNGGISLTDAEIETMVKHIKTRMYTLDAPDFAD